MDEKAKNAFRPIQRSQMVRTFRSSSAGGTRLLSMDCGPIGSSFDLCSAAAALDPLLRLHRHERLPAVVSKRGTSSLTSH